MAENDNELPVSAQRVGWRPLSNLSIAELRARAAEYRRMATTATTADVRDGLYRVADRFDGKADEMAKDT